MKMRLLYKISWRLKLLGETALKLRSKVREGQLTFLEAISLFIPKTLKRITQPNKISYERKLRSFVRRFSSYSCSASFVDNQEDLVECDVESTKIFLPVSVYRELLTEKISPNDLSSEQLLKVLEKLWIRVVFDEIFVRKIYDHKHAKVSLNEVVIDAGACEGFFTLYALQKGAYVHAFEPNPEMARALEKTLEFHGFESRATVHRVGLSDVVSESTLVVDPINLGGTSFSDSERELSKNQKELGKSIKVLTETLDNLYERGVIQRVDFIKADIEGYERRMLRGAEKVRKKFKPKLAICYYHLPDDLETLIKIVRSYNPKYKLAINDEVLFAWDENR